MKYFQKLFDSQGQNDASLILDHIVPKVTEAMNCELLLSFMNEEIKFAFFQMHPTKTPGPDGMSPGFYHKHWKIEGQDVCNGVRSLLSSGGMLQKINFTHVTLILNNMDPTLITQL